MKRSNEIVDRIRKEGIEPTPRWIFSARNVVVWILFLVSVLMGALAFSVVLFAVRQADFNIQEHMGHSGLELLLALLPALWLVLVLAGLIISILSIRGSRKGYKFNVFRMVSISVMISLTLGTLIFLTGGAEKLEHIFAVNVANYESIEERKMQIWNNPSQGYLWGDIDFAGDSILRITDQYDNTWRVNYARAFIAPVLTLRQGERIKLIGIKEGDNYFVASELRPWGSKGFSKQGGRKRKGIQE